MNTYAYQQSIVMPTKGGISHLLITREQISPSSKGQCYAVLRE